MSKITPESKKLNDLNDQWPNDHTDIPYLYNMNTKILYINIRGLIRNVLTISM